MNAFCVILNPRAGRGMGGQRCGELERALQAAALEYTLLQTDSAGSAPTLARRAMAQGYTRLVAVGGDGTLNGVASAILESAAPAGSVALGIVPMGTGNDFIKSLPGFVPNDIAGGVARLAACHTQRIDAGSVRVAGSAQNDGCYYFLNNLALGIDAHVAAESHNVPLLRGTLAYLGGAVRALFTYRTRPVLLRFAGRELQQPWLLATIANGRCQGGGFWLTPQAQLADGCFDLCLVEKLALHQMPAYILRAMRGAHTRLPRVHMAQASAIEVVYSAPALVVTDGETIASDAQHLQVELLPHALAFIV
jgi:YegS/Rv2252/BmrU family lipid kinase